MSARADGTIVQRSMDVLRRSMGGALGLLRRARKRRLSRQAGFALLTVMTAAALLGAIVGEFGYNARVELEAAANARDTLRAEYAARSGINLSRLLIKVQQSVIDKQFNRPPINADIQIMDFAPFLLGAFGGGDDERKAFGDLLGFDASSLKGLGLGKGVTIDPVLGTEDGKININCGGGYASSALGAAAINQNIPASPGAAKNPGGAAAAAANSVQTPALALYRLVYAALFPPRYRQLFDSPAPDGQYYTREDIARAIVDWSDIDEQRFDPLGAATGNGSGAGEDYRYDTLRDPYKAHNNYFDTVEELNLVRGVGDEFWGNFGSLFTVYGRCRVQLRAVGQGNWPVLYAIVRAAAANPQDPALADDNVVAALAQQIMQTLQFPGIVSNLAQFGKILGSGGKLDPAQFGAAAAQLLGVGGQIPSPFGNLPGIAPNQTILAAIARMGLEPNQIIPASREVYRIESTGTVKRSGDKKILVRIRAIFDTQRFNANTTSPDRNDQVGTWVYWRME